MARVVAPLPQQASATGTTLAGQPEDHNAALATFRTQESQRQVAFGHLGNDPSTQFDVIVLHICSLSWDDLDAAKVRNHPMLSHFDYLFNNFSTAASYSGPAAIRVLRASCGQEAHADLYKPAPQQCYLFSQLASAGYKVQSLLNHDGHFDNFLQVIHDNIGVPDAPPVSNAAAPVAMHAFDGSEIKSDYATLANWYAQRASVPPGRAVLQHDQPARRQPRRRQRADEHRLVSAARDEADGRLRSPRRPDRAIGPPRGDRVRAGARRRCAATSLRIAGLREIPTPRIVHGPVGVTGNHGATTVIDQPTASSRSRNCCRTSCRTARSPGTTLAQYAADLPRTRMVGENEGTVTMQTAAGYAVKTPDGVWIDEQ